MKPPPFRYARANNLEEAVSMLGEYGDVAKVLAGGQSLMPLLALRLARPEIIVDINALDELDYVKLDGSTLTIGALTRHRTVEHDPIVKDLLPFVSEAVGQIGHVAIRNRGTVGGSIVHADPAAEWPTLLLALDGEVAAVSSRGTRSIAATEFFTSYLTTALAADEIVQSVRFTLPQGAVGMSFLELARRHGDFAIVGVAVVVGIGAGGTVMHSRIALSGVASTVVRAENAENQLLGESFDRTKIEAAAEAVSEEIDPVGDIHGSSAYRRKVARVLTRRALATASERLEGKLNHG
jgi:carbon-monoxide dehydrogenase medium subunit